MERKIRGGIIDQQNNFKTAMTPGRQAFYYFLGVLGVLAVEYDKALPDLLDQQERIQ